MESFTTAAFVVIAKPIKWIVKTCMRIAMTNLTEIALEATGERLLADQYDEYTTEHLHRYAAAVPLTAGKNVLDIASGEGYGGNLLAKYANSVVGVDISMQAVEHANRKYKQPNLEFRVGSADQIPMSDNSLDIVVSFETLEHHDKHEQMLAEITRVLRPGGLLIMSTPDRRYFGGNPYHVKELDLNEFRELLKKYFTNVEIYFQKTYFGSLIVPEEKKNTSGMEIFYGDYQIIDSHLTIHEPTYNLCLASNQTLQQLQPSFFDGKPALDRLKDTAELVGRKEKQIQHLLDEKRRLTGSLSFKIGRSITAPGRWLNRLLK